MKKKVLVLTLLALFVLSGVVSAASLWGTYKGNNIIRLTIDGKAAKVSDVPVISYQGRTMVPIYLLNQAGINYTWDQRNQTVDVQKTSSPSSTSSGLNVPQISKAVKAHNIEFVEYVSDGKGFNSLTFYYDYALDQMPDQSFDALLTISANSDSTLTKIVDINNLTLKVVTSAVREFYAGQITAEQLKSRYEYEGNVQSQPAPTSGGSTLNSVITSTIDGTFEGFNYENIYLLQNGQIWKQTSFDISVNYKYMPKVTIYKDGSYWYMMVDGVDKKVKVERIK